MAAKKGAVSKSAGLDELKADLKAETLKNAYIFYGEETYLRQSYLDQVREALVPAGFEEFNYHRLGGKGLSMQTLQETVEAMPMMAQHTLVTVAHLQARYVRARRVHRDHLGYSGVLHGDFHL